MLFANDLALCCVEVFKFHGVSFSVDLSACANAVLFRKAFPVLMTSRLCSTFYQFQDLAIY